MTWAWLLFEAVEHVEQLHLAGVIGVDDCQCFGGIMCLRILMDVNCSIRMHIM